MRLLSRWLENKCRKVWGMGERCKPSNPNPPRYASQTCFSLEQIKRFRLKCALQHWWAKSTNFSFLPSTAAQEMGQMQQLHLIAVSWFNFYSGQWPLGIAQAMPAEFIVNSLTRSFCPHGADLKLTDGFQKMVQVPFSGTAQSGWGWKIDELDSAAMTNDLYADFTEFTWQ